MKFEKLSDSILVDELKSNDFGKVFGGARCTPDDDQPAGSKDEDRPGETDGTKATDLSDQGLDCKWDSDKIWTKTVK